MGLEELRKIKEGRGKLKEKKMYFIPNKSEKKIKQEEFEKSLRMPDEDNAMEGWFKSRRKELTGFCQCGCSQPSQKKDNNYFRHSCCHIFPKEKFESVRYHPMNFVERAFWGGCHTNMDERGMNRWPMMADWPDIIKKFYILSPLLTDQERGTKFYSQLESLVNA